jgi:hypothetical protein
MHGDAHTAHQKALSINLEGVKYGTIAEIGAGQEVAGWFFHVGKASSTVARSISANDMAISDALYGPARHYVSRARLEAMLDHEFDQLVAKLDGIRGERNAFFVFANTVATHGSTRSSGGQGWLGVRFQDRPRDRPSEVIIHIEMSDPLTVGRQEAAGLVGVNLIYGAFCLHQDPGALIRSLMDGLDRRRIEIDMIKFSGPLFEGVDNRLMSLQLVEQGLTDVAMFTADGEVVQPSEVLYNRSVLVERGSFRPVTNVSLAMIDAAVERLKTVSSAEHDEGPAVVMEMTLNNLVSGPSIDHEDFLARAAVLGALNKMVMISNYTRFDCVTTYLRQYTNAAIGMIAGIPTFRAIFEEQYYKELAGGILEGLGRLFMGPTKLFVYPTISGAAGQLETVDQTSIDSKLKFLYAYVFANGYIEALDASDTAQLHVSPGDVLQKIQSGDEAWMNFVPAPAAAVIRERNLFGFGNPDRN